MLLSEIVKLLTEVLEKEGDLPFTCTVMNSHIKEDAALGQDFVEIILKDCSGDPCCDLIMEYDAVHRMELEEKNKDA